MLYSTGKVPRGGLLNGKKTVAAKFVKVEYLLNYEGRFVVDAVGRNGDLAMLWKHSDQVRVLNYSQRHIMVNVEDEQVKVACYLMGF